MHHSCTTGVAQQEIHSSNEREAMDSIPKEQIMLCVKCHCHRNSRNLLIFKNKREDSQSSVAAAEAVVQAYRRIQMPLMQEGSRHEDAVQKGWKPPPAGWFQS